MRNILTHARVPAVSAAESTPRFIRTQMRFPLVLDMNRYVDDPGQSEGGVGGGAGVGGAPGGIVRERSDFQVIGAGFLSLALGVSLGVFRVVACLPAPHEVLLCPPYV